MLELGQETGGAIELGAPDNIALQRPAPRLRTHMRHWLRHQLRTRLRRAAAERGCYPDDDEAGVNTEVKEGGNMGDGSKPEVPVILWIAAGLTFFNSWVLFEETVVDRHGLWRYLPFYKVGLFCVWDALALALVAAVLAVVWRGRLGKLGRLCPVACCRFCH